MSAAERKRVLVGVGHLNGDDGQPVRWTRRQVARWADRQARRKRPKGFWTAHVIDVPGGFRVSFGGQPQDKT